VGGGGDNAVRFFNSLIDFSRPSNFCIQDPVIIGISRRLYRKNIVRKIIASKKKNHRTKINYHG
jgi:hypothetical protein